MSSDRGASSRYLHRGAMIGIGSIPGIGNATGEDREVGRSTVRHASVISSTCAVVNSAVTLTFTPLSESSRTSGAIDSPLVVVTGILT